MLFKLEHWVLPVTVLTFAICLLNFREVFAMVEKLLGMVLHRRKKIKLSFKQVLFFLLKDCPCVVHGLFFFPFCGRFYYIVPHYVEFQFQSGRPWAGKCRTGGRTGCGDEHLPRRTLYAQRAGIQHGAGQGFHLRRCLGLHCQPRRHYPLLARRPDPQQKDFENVITLGMRGENDTAIMQHATLEENIQLIRNVLKTQNQLIREIINPDVRQVPRQIVFFSETEEFFYGSKETPGLIGDPELDGVTLMLSDNNHGSTRTLPSPEMRSHPGGYGMYYHMDMHGGPHSFEWVGATYLPKVWEEMTAAYEYGVREIWVTNIGDIGTQEFGLSYFLDLAYDIDAWGGQDAAITTQYTAQWVRRNFGVAFAPADLPRIEGIITDYTRLLARRKHEKMGENTYHPTHYGEAEEVLQISEHILTECDALKRALLSR